MISKRNIVILFLLAIFVTMSVFLYYKYVKPRMNPSYIENKEFLSNENGTIDESTLEDVELIIFYTTWCPHSKTAIKSWSELKPKYDNKVYNKYRLILKEVDCDKDVEMADKYNIEGYPTIKLVKNDGNEVVEYDAKLNEETLNEFLNSVLN